MAQRQTFFFSLSGEVRHVEAHPCHQQHGQQAHDAEAHAPSQDIAQKGSGRDAQRERQWCAHHRNRDGAAFAVFGHQARGIAGQ
ncbi:hypothetical protein D3C86_2020930 [compost metagenome]